MNLIFNYLLFKIIFFIKATISVFLELRILNPSVSLIVQLNPVIKLVCNILRGESLHLNQQFCVIDRSFKNLYFAFYPQVISFKQESEGFISAIIKQYNEE